MRILFLGDVVARPGREALAKILPTLKERYDPDLTIANAENIAHGKGVTLTTLTELQKYGVDFFTSGNHVWGKEGTRILENKDFPLIRPANYPPGVIGDGYRILTIRSQKIAIINLIGRTFFKASYDCPFRKMDEILKDIKKEDCSSIFVDFHCEATSEIRALGYYLDGRVSAVIGTHTHVQTADEQILPQGMAYLSDSGMCGVKDSILGKNLETVINSFLKQDSVSSSWDNDWKECIIQGVFLEIKRNLKAEKIERFSEIIENN